jgi:nucleoside-diphosphate-sugar epimerase
MKVIVTGATGFVGQNLIPYLQKQNVEVIPLNLRDNHWQDQLQATTYDAIIHLAGKAHDVKNTSDASAYFKINTELTQVLFDIFLKSNAKDFLYFSSVKAVADTVVDALTEEVKANPITPYGQSKQQAEQYLLSKTLTPTQRLFILRPCMIHGPGNKGNLNLLYNVVAKNIPYPLASFHNNRSFLSISNLNFCVKELLNSKTVKGGVYNLADDSPISTNTLIKIIASTLGKRPKLWACSTRLIKSLARIGDVIKLPLNSSRLQKLTENYVVSNEKIKQALHLKQLPLSVEEGLTLTIQSFAKA